jgi:hypothetical protein
MGWATFSAIFSQIHLVTVMPMSVPSRADFNAMLQYIYLHTYIVPMFNNLEANVIYPDDKDAFIIYDKFIVLPNLLRLKNKCPLPPVLQIS